MPASAYKFYASSSKGAKASAAAENYFGTCAKYFLWPRRAEQSLGSAERFTKGQQSTPRCALLMGHPTRGRVVRYAHAVGRCTVSREFPIFTLGVVLHSAG